MEKTNETIKESPRVTDDLEWCLKRVDTAIEELDRAQREFKRCHEIIGVVISELRRDAKISMIAIAKRMNISDGDLVELESGRQIWTKDLIKRYFDALAREYTSS